MIGEVDGDLRRRDRIAGEGDQRRPLEERRNRGDIAALESDLGEAIFRDLHARARLPHLPTQMLHLGDGEAGIVSHDDDLGGLEDLTKGGDELAFFRAIQLSSLRLAVRCLPSPPG